MQPEQEPLTRNDFGNAINRCIKAYREVRAKLPPNADGFDRAKNKEAASDAYLKELPLLIDPQSFQLYIACISHGASLGIIDPVDVGRFCHIATTAISAWKLVNLIIPAANARERAAEEKQHRNQARQSTVPGSADSAGSAGSAGPADSTPLPSKGNQSDDALSNYEVDQALQKALNNLPLFEVQKQHFQLLRDRGKLLPSDSELRANPLAALYLCRMAESVIQEETLAEAAQAAQPGPNQDPQHAPASQEHQAEAA